MKSTYKFITGIILVLMTVTFTFAQQQIYAVKFSASDLPYFKIKNCTAYRISNDGVMVANEGYQIEAEEDGTFTVRVAGKKKDREKEEKMPKIEKEPTTTVECIGNCPTCGKIESDGVGGEILVTCGGDCSPHMTCGMLARILPGNPTYIKQSSNDDWRRNPNDI
ncbi:MAG TPA: hypothetical protein P5275_11905 [Saprospiraceae bacterium]|nr:hypothetical protein [Saprospiraceae bacterium]MCB9268142.1 hypothetical protein [Lewinellaceae bacterium]HPG08309.1 hypothetical protein [Saprospiraceae bacterium]HPR01466.1 hypothetical protein [Saprospiraceae bacterium]HQU54879.1 hypothetical protein [Saprospiraceae bacterium]